MIFCQLNPETSKSRLVDFMGHLHPNELIAIDTHDADVIEIVCFVPVDWYHSNKHHLLVSDYIRYNYYKPKQELWIDI